MRASGPASSSGYGSAHCCGPTGRSGGRCGTHQHRRLARYWSAGAGLDDSVIDALRTRRLDGLEVVEPTADELARQLLAELPVSRRHLRTVVERYWDEGWRREHKGCDESPEDHLWRAAAAVSEMQDALDELET
jgi:hypothetical protein